MDFIAYVVTRRSTGRVCYVGITAGSLAKRWRQHKRRTDCRRLYNAIQKYGAEAFGIEAVASSWDRASLALLEAVLVLQHNTLSPNGYNLTTGGEGAFERSAETRARMSVAFKGRVISAEAKAKLSAVRAGKPLSLAHRAAVSLATKGKPQSSVLRTKRAAAQIGRVMSPETRAKISASNKGKTQTRTAATIEKVRQSLLKYYATRSPEQRREHMRAAFTVRNQPKS